MSIFLILLLAVPLLFLISFSWDDSRIRKYAQREGWVIISKKWAPFGLGWAGDESNNIYKIIYLDRNGDKYEAFFKTSIFSGVYISKNTAIELSENTLDNNKKKESLEEENMRLKKELEALKKTDNPYT